MQKSSRRFAPGAATGLSRLEKSLMLSRALSASLQVQQAIREPLSLAGLFRNGRNGEAAAGRQ
jgi:hypothetical protein